VFLLADGRIRIRTNNYGTGKPKKRIRNTDFIDCQQVLPGKGLLSAAGIVIYTIQLIVRITIHVPFVQFVQTKKNCQKKTVFVCYKSVFEFSKDIVLLYL
jgi:hypothetical protein